MNMGAFLIFPLKNKSSVMLPRRWMQYKTMISDLVNRKDALRLFNDSWSEYEIATPDIQEQVKKLFRKNHETKKCITIGKCFSINPNDFVKGLLSVTGGIRSKTIRCLKDNCTFELVESYLYIFDTEVAFLCVGILFDRIEVLDSLCKPGYAKEDDLLEWKNENQRIRFRLSNKIKEYIEKLGQSNFQLFLDTNYIVSEAFVHSFSVTQEIFEDFESINQKTFNMHKMIPLDTELQDDAEEVRYVYAIKDSKTKTHKWGCCISAQTISYITTVEKAEQLDAAIRVEMVEQAQNGLPLVVIVLYQKYTCMLFSQKIIPIKKKMKKSIRKLKEQLMEFMAYGIVETAEISRWSNVKKIYSDLLELTDTDSEIQNISHKIDLLSSYQEHKAETQMSFIALAVTTFGILVTFERVKELLAMISLILYNFLAMLIKLMT